jgi:hypothetical protein
MTSITPKTEDTTALGTGCPEDTVLRARYSNKELKLIKDIWADTQVVARSRTKLALDLLELKQEMDKDDPNRNGGGTEELTKFWTAFGNGDLPQIGSDSRASVHVLLQAAKFLQSGTAYTRVYAALESLTPKTLCNLSRVTNSAAITLIERHLEVHGFIGHDASAFLAKAQEEATVIARLDDWVTSNPTKALVPSVIRDELEAVKAEQKPAEQTVTVPPPSVRTPVQTPTSRPPFTLVQAARPPGPTAQAKAVQEELDRPERERQEELRKYHKKYSDALVAAIEGLRGLKRTLNEIRTIKGTIYLNELRELPCELGFNYIANDVEELKACRDLLLEIVKTATSQEGPQTIDFETVNAEVVQ